VDQQQAHHEADQHHECSMAKIRAKEVKASQKHEQKMLELKVHQSEIEVHERAMSQLALLSPIASSSSSPAMSALDLDFLNGYIPNIS